MSHSEDRLKVLVKDLRRQLGTDGKAITQTEMAFLVGRTLVTVQRYESSGVIPVDALGAYCRVAIEAGAEAATDLRSILIEQIGEDSMAAILWNPGDHRKLRPIQSSIPDSMRGIIDEIVDLLQNPQTEAEIAETRFLVARMEERHRRRSRGNGTK